MAALTRPTRPRIVAALAMVVAGVLVLATGPGAAAAGGATDEFVLGSGRADARVLRVGPSAARLGLAPSAALSLADFLGTRGRGESRALEYAALEGNIEDLEADAGQPILTGTLYPNVKVESTDEGSEAGTEATHPPFTQFARATDAPWGEAVSTLSGFSIPGVIEISAGVARAFAGHTDRDGAPVRIAGGTVDVGRVSLGGGAVVLRGLRWEATQITDSNDDTTPEITTRFVVGSATVGGELYEGPLTGDDLAAALSAANDVLAPTGLRLRAPTGDGTAGVARIGPLAVSIVDSQVGSTLLGPVVEGAQPIREPVFGQIVDNGGASLVLVADVGLGVLTGAGRLDVEIGGATGFTEGQVFESPFGTITLPEPPPPATAPPTTAAAPAPAPAPRPAATPVAAVPPTTTTTSPPPAPAPTPVAAPAPTPEPVRPISTSVASAAWGAIVLGGAWAAAQGVGAWRRLRAHRLGIPI